MTLFNLGIIPAAGRAERFDGVLKELLPCGGGETFLSRCYRILRLCCGRVIVVSNSAKIGQHVAALGDRAWYAINDRPESDMWWSIEKALPIFAKRYYFAMPDTYFPVEAFNYHNPEIDFVLGVHRTDKPERFGMIRDNRIVNKQPGLPGLAWGVFSFSDKIRHAWMMHCLVDYTDAINKAMSLFDWRMDKLEYYYDIANLDSYAEFLNRGEE